MRAASFAKAVYLLVAAPDWLSGRVCRVSFEGCCGGLDWCLFLRWGGMCPLFCPQQADLDRFDDKLPAKRPIPGPLHTCAYQLKPPVP